MNPPDAPGESPGAGKFTRLQTALGGVTLIRPVIHRDHRGFFLESYNKEEFKKLGIFTEYLQDNHSYSEKGVIRGLHFQRIHPQEKLVRVVRGSVFDVAVDIRNESPNFGKSIGIILSPSDMTLVHIPVGFAHGFLALEDNTQVLYKTSELYDPQYEGGVVWCDPDLDIPWPLEKYEISQPIISDKDQKLPFFSDLISSAPERGNRFL